MLAAFNLSRAKGALVARVGGRGWDFLLIGVAAAVLAGGTAMLSQRLTTGAGDANAEAAAGATVQRGWPSFAEPAAADAPTARITMPVPVTEGLYFGGTDSRQGSQPVLITALETPPAWLQ